MGMKALLLSLSLIMAGDTTSKYLSFDYPFSGLLSEDKIYGGCIEKPDPCKDHLNYLRDGQALFQVCIKKYICALQPCDKLRPEQANLILQAFKALQQFIVLHYYEYEEALDNCDILKTYYIAQKQFALLDTKINFYAIMIRCKKEVESVGNRGVKICGESKMFQIKGPDNYGCIIPSFIVKPAECLVAPRNVDVDVLAFIIAQIKKNSHYAPYMNHEKLNFLQKIFAAACDRESPAAIIRIKVVLLILITDFRTKSLDCTFEKYCQPILCDDKNQFVCNIDPVVACLFGPVV